jgi:hypothetical protein
MTDKIQVEVGADNSELLSGMKEAASSVEDATKGMSGSITDMIETMEKMGPAALGLAAVGLAFEGLKEVISTISENIEQVHQLAESFRSLSYVTGASTAELNTMTLAMQMSGGQASDVDGLMRGMSRAIKTNGDVLVANGMASSTAALRGMSFVDYLTKAAEIADDMAPGQDRELFLMQALGKSGVELGSKLHEMVEHMKEASSQPPIVTAASLQLLKDSQKATADLAAANLRLANSYDATWTPIAIWFKKFKTANAERLADEDLVAEMLAKGEIKCETFLDRTGDSFDTLRKKALAARDAEVAAGNFADFGNDVGAAKPKPAQKDVTQQDLEAKKAAAKAAADLAAQMADKAMEAQINAAKHALQVTEDYDKQAVAEGRMTADEAADAKIAAINRELAAEVAAYNERESKLGGKKADPAKDLELEQKKVEAANSAEHQISEVTTESIKQQEAAVDAWSKAYIDAHKEAAKQAAEAMKEAAREQMAQSKDAIVAARTELDEKVQMGLISQKDELAARKALLDKEHTLDIEAKDAEMAAVDINDAEYINKVQKLANQEMDIDRKYNQQKLALDKQAKQQQIQVFDQLYGAMTSGFQSSITGLIKGTMTWGEAFKNVMNQALDSLINLFVQWGVQAAEMYLKSLIFGEATNTTQATEAAAVYGVNAMASAAAIPIYGWAMAPEIGAEAYASGLAFAGLASAEGGWENVPNDQLMQIHKQEMVLPAQTAQTVRDAVSGNATNNSGFQKSGDIHFHNHAVDAKGFQQMLSRPSNARALRGLAKSAQKSFGRLS